MGKNVLNTVSVFGVKMLDIPLLNKLQQYEIDFSKKRISPLFLDEYVEVVKELLNWYSSTVASILNNKRYKDSNLCDFVFKESCKSELDYNNAIKMHLFVSSEYAVFLTKTLNVSNVVSLREKIQFAIDDFESLLIEYACVFENKNGITPHGGRKGRFCLINMRDCMEKLFMLGHYQYSSNIINDMSFYSIFSIRQFIESWGKRIIGYEMIYDQNDQPIKKFTQIGWDFISEQVKKGNIKLPFNLDQLMHIYRWSNIFTHMTHLYAAYMQFYAITMVEKMFATSDGIPKKIYNNRLQTKACADVLIYNYNQVKQDLEDSLKEKNFGNSVKIVWTDVDKNEAAYIMTL
ncbi:hypothetical protein [Fibrobacter succinogenes]|uniref:Uncharacterized protein n=1 Tax=Fibrobacter succinogenes TaxID=833 RepID=A0A380S670_FIBSU|nr:hypothetical protein [Fibrobacter succinogenes]PWJ35838.1 hypothetical protein IE02_1899 [Fibrobacter succinogenes subsp. elongatus]SUQ24493.1 hypothetical protein SAMN05661053_1899 [Fibrobacter succinogenes]